MLAFPLHPRYARMLLAGQEYGCVHQACLVAALTQGRDLLIRNAGREAGSARGGSIGEQGVFRFLDFDARLEFMRRRINSAWTSAASWEFIPSPPGR